MEGNTDPGRSTPSQDSSTAEASTCPGHIACSLPVLASAAGTGAVGIGTQPGKYLGEEKEHNPESHTYCLAKLAMSKAYKVTSCLQITPYLRFSGSTSLFNPTLQDRPPCPPPLLPRPIPLNKYAREVRSAKQFPTSASHHVTLTVRCGSYRSHPFQEPLLPS